MRSRSRNSPRKCARESSTTLSRAPNGIIIGEALAEKLGVKTGNTVLLIGGQGIQLNSTVAGLFRSGLKRVDESQIYSLMGPAQVMMGQSGRRQPAAAAAERSDGGAKGRGPGRSADRLQVGVLAGSQCRPAVDLHRARFHRAHGDGRDAADVLLCHLQHHLDDHPREAPGHRDHEIAGHARVRGATDLHHRSRHHRRGRHPVRMDPRLPALLRLVEDHDLQSADGHDRSAADLLLADRTMWSSAAYRCSAAQVRPTSRRARRRGCIRSKSSGGRHDRGRIAGGGAGPPHRGRPLRTPSSTASIWR